MMPASYIADKIANRKKDKLTESHPASLADIKRKAVFIGLGAVGLGITFIIARKVIKDIRKKRSERKFSVETQQALLIHTALNPIGISWLRWIDGTREEELYNIAAQITNFKRVQQEYQNLFDRSLVVDLEKELKTEEYTKFMSILNSGEYDNNTMDDGNGNNTNPYEVNDGQVALKVILIKNTTKIYEKFTWYPIGSVKKVQPNTFINHLATGNIKKLDLGYGKVAQFVETRIKTTGGLVKTIYVNRDDVSLVSKEDFNNYLKSSYTKIVFNDDDF